MWKKVFDKLRTDGLNPHPPAVHTGDCLERYCVLTDGVQMASFSSNQIGHGKLDVILFVPNSSYVAMEDYKKLVRKSLDEIKGIRRTGFETPTIQDEGKKAYTSSIEVMTNKRIGRKC